MSKLEELINEFCPNGVEYKKLGETLKIERGVRVVKSQLTTQGIYPVYQNSLTPMGYYDKFNFSAETAFIIGAGSAGEIGYSNTDFWAADDCYCLICNENLNSRYLYHCLLNNSGYITSKVRKASIPRLSRGVIESLQIPLPALPVQREIVRILDSFTLYSAELTAELTARRKQYEFYRDKLLTFEKTEVKQMPLGKLAKFTYGYTDVAKDVGDARFIRITDINEDGCLASGNCKYITLNDESKKYLLKEGDLLLARTGATYGKTLYFPNNEPAVYASFLIKIDLDNSVILNRYYWHFSKSNLYWKQADKYVSKAGQQQFNTNAVSRVIVPVPPIEVQERIVKVLDNFDEICSNLKIGLPAEMEKRQQQYEYYRDKLLEFNVNINKDINIAGGGAAVN